ncbi:hypothetical protein BOTBODRAFT_62228 [Botryobasidium botryosum FD-172 SS1]|uniref:ABC transporter domain-containing protein n=1 Tax=Botryobasidium botryosum (strain FD-172 SS1) TaxID=930990 RepID=A0A067N6W0_BOTB1|nr:hypothetical protein BOTBODRAFT_62228 [Botryobasidium botryosum FD-172 SS1]
MSKRTRPSNHHDELRDVIDAPQKTAADYNIKHIRNDIWDFFYRKRSHRPQKTTGISKTEIVQTLPFLQRYVHEIVDAGRGLLVMYTLVSFALALIPAFSIHFSGELLNMVKMVIEKREVDKEKLIYIVGVQAICPVATNLCNSFTSRYEPVLRRRINKNFDEHLLQARLRLDLPTYEDPVVQARLEACSDRLGAMGWNVFNDILEWFSRILSFTSQVSVVAKLLHDQQSGFLAILSIVCHISAFLLRPGYPRWNSDWVVFSDNSDIEKINGLRKCAVATDYRKEVIAGNLQEYIQNEHRQARESLGDAPALVQDAQWETRFAEASNLGFLGGLLERIPEVYLAVRAIHTPTLFATSFASLKILQENATSLARKSSKILTGSRSILTHIRTIRDFYEIINIPNQIVDGTEAYPVDHDKDLGTSVEFKDVCFRYPGAKEDCLRKVSFKIKPGQICVIVGANGEGKSTIIKLINRLYDCTEGQILLDGKDIRSFKLADLRKSMSVLYQDYRHLPVSIGKNIGMGDPDNADNEMKIHEAASLGGASDFIKKLPSGFQTVMENRLNMSVGGRKGESLYEDLVQLGLVKAPAKGGLSGGQLQRLALSRTFMRSRDEITLCLYDEPSAALDPQAEYDLFQRLRLLKGQKTMVFSSHRFGHLTKHADVILYVKGGTVCEAGTHAELLAKGELYAQLYNVQAQAFQE